MAGALIVFEGINGSGKTTLINMLKTYLNQNGFKVKIYKFPNRQSPIGNKIDMFLKKEIQIESKYDIIDMFAKDREYANEQILTDLHDGYIVLIDRYIFSGIAYQINHDATDLMIHSATRIIGHFDKNILMPTMVYLIKGDHLEKRNEKKERYHHHDRYDLLKIAGAKNLKEANHPKRAVYVLGAEDYGIPEEIMKGYQKVFIDTTFCLNVAVAGSIVLYDRDYKK
jgi:dTMP kinase